MNTYKAKLARAGITFGLIILCAIALICTGIFSPIGVSNEGIKITQTASSALNPTYGAFFHGSTYRYTDSTKVEGAHSGSISDDTTLVTVDSSYAHGTQKNPYVIDSIARWNAFVADMANTTSGITDHGKGKFFALACDLDFNGITFAPVNNFAGKFYGLGHTISNITYDANGKHCGLFSNTYDNFLVADLILSNYTYSNTQLTGALVGVALSGSTEVQFLNCHTDGKIIRNNNGVDLKTGGIIGHSDNLDNIESKLLLYRCSTKLTVECSENNPPYDISASPFVGQAMRHTSVNILDCYGDLTLTIISLKKCGYYTGFVGSINQNDRQFTIENSAAKTKVERNANAAGVINVAGSILGLTNNDTARTYTRKEI